MRMDLSRSMVGTLLAAAVGVAGAQSAPGGHDIYSCRDAAGKMLRGDRPIAGCVGDQVVLNPDGSIKRVVPRTLTEEERAAAEARQREEDAARSARQVQERADRALLHRYPDKAKHDLARKEALDSAGVAIRGYDARIAELMRERKPILDEMEFYVGKPLPAKVKSALDANDASLAAQKALRQNQEAELVRINKLFDDELGRLRALWAGKPVR